MKKIVSILTAATMLVGCMGITYAAGGSDRNSRDFAVVSNGDLDLHNTMRIEGDAFVNGNVVMDNAGDNLIEGNVICTGEFILPEYTPVNPTGSVTEGTKSREINYDIIAEKCDEAAGDISIFDSVDYVDEYEWLDITSWSWIEEFRSGMTVSDNTYFKGGLTLYEPLTIDTTNGDVYVKIDSITAFNTPEDACNGMINVVGDNKAYIYMGASYGGVSPLVNCEITYDEDKNRIVEHGDNSKVDLYIDAFDGYVALSDSSAVAADIYICNAVDAEVGGKVRGKVHTDSYGVFQVSVSGSTRIDGDIFAKNASEVYVYNDVYGDFVSGASSFTITGGCSNIEGVVYVPNADVAILANNFKGIDGQLVANRLDLHGTGVIKYNKDSVERFYGDSEYGAFIPNDETIEDSDTNATETVVVKEETAVLVKDTIYAASALNSSTKDFADAWDVEAYTEDYAAMGETFGSLEEFEANYTTYISSDVIATILVPETGDYTFSYMLREYRDRGFNVTFTKVDETEAAANVTTINNITKVAKSGSMNMGVSQSTVTLETGEYTMTLTADRGTHLCGFKFESVEDNMNDTVTEPTEAPAVEPTDVPVEEVPAPTEEVIDGFRIEELIPNTTDVRPNGPVKLTSDYAYLFGYSPTVSGANNAITREELSALVNRVLLQNDARDGFRKPNRESFDDLSYDWWSHGAVEYMTEIGVYNSESDSVMPWQPASRWEVAKVVAVALGLEPSEDDSNFNFTDKDEYFCQKYYRYIKAMVDYGYYTGHGDGSIRANDSMTRAEFVTMFNRILGRTEANGYTLENLLESVENPNIFIDDLDDTHWAYLDILNAAYSFTDGKVDLTKTIDRTAIDYELFD